MQKITNELIYKYSFLSSLKSNQYGDKAIFLKQKANKENNNYESNLYLYQNSKVTKISSCKSAKQPFWYNNEEVVFISERENSQEKKGDTKNKSKEKDVRLFKKNINTMTEAEFFIDLNGDISSIDKINEKKLIYIKERKINKADDIYFAEQKDEEGYMKISRMPFYNDGSTFDFHKKNSLYIYNLKTKKEEEINLKNYSVESYNISKDKTKIIIVASKIQKRRSTYEIIFEYDLESEKLTKLVDELSNKQGYSIYLADYLDSKPFFLATKMQEHGLNENPIAYVIENANVKELNSEDIDYFNSGVQDMQFDTGKEYITFDKHLEFITTYGTINQIIKLDVTGNISKRFKFKGGISCFDYVDGELIFIGLNSEGGQELYVKDKKITNFHDFLQGYYVVKPEKITIDSFEDKIDGFVLLPQDYHQNKTYPAVLEIHGGPKMAYQNTYFHEMQMLSAEGYVVIFCNPRGSAGKGSDFFDIFGSYGKVDYNNIIDFTKFILKKYPQIDKNRLFITGGSYGGYMTNHIVGQTDMFKAAVTQRSISNWVSMYGVSDIGYYFAPDQHRTKVKDKDFWQNLWDVSPLKNTGNIKTPTLIIHSDCDYRCPLEQGYQLFTALLDRGVDSELLVFKNEQHGLSRQGKPHNRITRLEAIKNWFKKYDK